MTARLPIAHHLRRALPLAFALLAACGAPGPKRSEDATEAPKPVVVRPVVVAAQGTEEMVRAVGLWPVAENTGGKGGAGLENNFAGPEARPGEELILT